MCIAHAADLKSKKQPKLKKPKQYRVVWAFQLLTNLTNTIIKFKKSYKNYYLKLISLT